MERVQKLREQLEDINAEIAMAERNYDLNKAAELKYGKLPEDWPNLIHDGFWECMRVLKPHGTLVFKWSEIDIPTRMVIDAIGCEPLFGHRSGKAMKTHWLCFMKGVNDE